VTQTAAPPQPVVVLPPEPARHRGALSRTPGRMRLAGVFAVFASLVVGVLGVQAGLAQSKALASADADTRQLVGVQDVRNDLVVADATATNAFLVGGLEPPAQRPRHNAQHDVVQRHAVQLLGGLQVVEGEGDGGEVAPRPEWSVERGPRHVQDRTRW